MKPADAKRRAICRWESPGRKDTPGCAVHAAHSACMPRYLQPKSARRARLRGKTEF